MSKLRIAALLGALVCTACTDDPEGNARFHNVFSGPGDQRPVRVLRVHPPAPGEEPVAVTDDRVSNVRRAGKAEGRPDVAPAEPLVGPRPL